VYLSLVLVAGPVDFLGLTCCRTCSSLVGEVGCGSGTHSLSDFFFHSALEATYRLTFTLILTFTRQTTYRLSVADGHTHLATSY